MRALTAVATLPVTGAGNAERYNRNWAGIIDAWAKLLTNSIGGTKRAFGLEDGAGIDADFEVSPVTGWSRPSHHHVYFDRTT